jgi:hypothetical protein
VAPSLLVQLPLRRGDLSGEQVSDDALGSLRELAAELDVRFPLEATMRTMIAMSFERMNVVAGSTPAPENGDFPQERQWFRVKPLREALDALQVNRTEEQPVSLCYGFYREDGDIGQDLAEDWTFDIVLPVIRGLGDDAVPEMVLRGGAACSAILRQQQVCLAEKQGTIVSRVCLVPKSGDVSLEDRKKGAANAMTATEWWPCWSFRMQASSGRTIDRWFPRASDARDQLARRDRAGSAASLGLFAMKTGRDHWESQDKKWREACPPISGFSVRPPALSSQETNIDMCVVSIGAHPSYDHSFWSQFVSDLGVHVRPIGDRMFELIVPT